MKKCCHCDVDIDPDNFAIPHKVGGKLYDICDPCDIEFLNLCVRHAKETREFLNELGVIQ